MINFYKDKALRRAVNVNSPKWVLIRESGAEQETTLYLADAGYGILASSARPGDTTLNVYLGERLPNFGWVRLGTQIVHYTGKNGSILTGIPAAGNGSLSEAVLEGTAVRSLNREYTAGNCVISPAADAGTKIYLRNQAATWIPNGSAFVKQAASYNLNGSPLICSFSELAGDQNFLFDYDFTDRATAKCADLSRNGNDALIEGGVVVKVAADVLTGFCAQFLSGGYLRIPKLATVFPVTGSIELWVNMLTQGCTLFSVNDEITGAEKLSLRTTNLGTIRVVAQLPSGLVKSYEGRVPANLTDWNQIALSWTPSALTLYLNGAVDSTFALDAPLQSGTGDAFLGKSSAIPFYGRFYRTRLWSRTLGADQVATKWNEGQGWAPGMNEPVLSFQIKAATLPGKPQQFSASVSTQPINGYDHDPAAVSIPLILSRRNQGVAGQLRVLPPDRQIPDTLPAFEWGTYRWRDNEQSSKEVVPTSWDMDVSIFADKTVVSGIGLDPDLEPLKLIKINEENSIHPVIRPGDYFIGWERNYLPAVPVLDIVDATSTGPFKLSSKPRPTTPIFIGRWRSNSVDRYVKDIEYRFAGKAMDPNGPPYQFLLDRKKLQVSLNQKLQPEAGFLGIYPATGLTFTFRLPVHPVFAVSRVYLADNTIPAKWSFDQAAGTLTVQLSADQAVAFANQIVSADYTPGLAIYYDRGAKGDVITVSDVELNPAFAGIANGTVYLQHKIWQPKQLQLQVDKPRVPYTGQSGKPEDIEFGPVYPNDYAVLTVTAFGNNEDELIAGARLKVQIDPTQFVGTINYHDPRVEDVWVTTGADGSSSLVFTPGNTFGYYLALSSVSGNKLPLPAPVDLGRLYDDSIGQFVVHTYGVLNDDPYLGKVGAETATGEVAWKETGTPGTTGYQANGRRILWKDPDGTPVYPTDLLDSNNYSYTDARFSGQVKYITFHDSLQTAGNVGAYFVPFTGKVTIYLTSLDYNVITNPISLRIVPPEQITEISLVDDSVWQPIAGYLTMNDFTQKSGRLNVNRLAGGHLLELRFQKRI